jgi:hypothetical protein
MSWMSLPWILFWLGVSAFCRGLTIMGLFLLFRSGVLRVVLLFSRFWDSLLFVSCFFGFYLESVFLVLLVSSFYRFLMFRDVVSWFI